MKQLLSLLMIATLGACNMGPSKVVGPGKLPFSPVLLTSSGLSISSITFNQQLIPGYSSYLEQEVMIKNTGVSSGPVELTSTGVSFSIYTNDNRCNGNNLLAPGESCLLRVRFTHDGGPSGSRAAQLILWGDGAQVGSYPVGGTISNSI